MIIAFLKELEKSQNTANLSTGQLLINFLYFYAYDFDNKNQHIFINLKTNENFFYKNNQQFSSNKDLYIYDHQNEKIWLTKVFKNA